MYYIFVEWFSWFWSHSQNNFGGILHWTWSKCKQCPLLYSYVCSVCGCCIANCLSLVVLTLEASDEECQGSLQREPPVVQLKQCDKYTKATVDQRQRIFTKWNGAALYFALVCLLHTRFQGCSQESGRGVLVLGCTPYDSYDVTNKSAPMDR